MRQPPIHDDSAAEPWDELATRLSQLRPDAMGLNRDQLLFAAGRSAAETGYAVQRVRRWQATSFLLGGLLALSTAAHSWRQPHVVRVPIAERPATSTIRADQNGSVMTAQRADDDRPAVSGDASPDQVLESLRRLPRYARQLPRSTAELFAAPAHHVAQVDPRSMQRFQLIQKWESEASHASRED